MKNNSLPITQNICNSGVENPYQPSPNLNYYFYLMPENTQFFFQPLNLYQILSMNYLQNSPQSLIMNMNKDKNEIPMYYNYTFNNIYSPANAFQFCSPIFPTNTHLNLGLSNPSPPIEDTSFLNKKRNGAIEKENETNLCSKAEEKTIELKEAQKITNMSYLENNETKCYTKEENNNKEIISGGCGEKEKIKNDKNDEKEKKDENKIENISSLGNYGQEKEKEEKDKKAEKKKGIKKKRNYRELLEDTFLVNICEPKKKNPIVENNFETINKKISTINTNRTELKNKIKSKANKSKTISKRRGQLSLEEKTIDNSETKEKNKKSKIKNQCHQKKKQHKLTIKKNNDMLADLQKNNSNEKAESNPKLTKVIFHGENYENTKSVIDFMKYNFDFKIEEQYKTKKLITDYGQQHIDLTKFTDNYYENYNLNEQNLDKIEQKWSRKRFEGDNKELKKVINIIRDSFPGRKIDTNEEKCLSILKNNGYNIEEFINSNHIN